MRDTSRDLSRRIMQSIRSEHPEGDLPRAETTRSQRSDRPFPNRYREEREEERAEA